MTRTLPSLGSFGQGALALMYYHVWRANGREIVKIVDVLRRRAGRLLAMVVLAVGIVVGDASTAFAHAQLESTTPTAGSVLTSAPTDVTMTFGEPVEIPLGSVQVLDGAGRSVVQGKPFHPGGVASKVAQDLQPGLPDGGYVVVWRVISADSHPVHGAFTFSIGSGTISSATTAHLLAKNGGSRAVGVVYGVVRALGYVAVAVLIGGTMLVVGAWPAGRRRRTARLLLWTAWGASAFTALAAIALEGVYGAARPLQDLLQPTLLHAALRTRAGVLDAWRFAIVVAIAGPLLALLMNRTRTERGRAVDRVAIVGAIVVGLLVLGTFSLAGHAATGRGAGFAAVIDVGHLAGVSVWVGGLAMLVVATRRKPDGITPAGLRRFSLWAVISVAAIAVSGGFEAWRQVGTWGAVLTTSYGRLLVAKTVGFAVILCFGAANRRRVAALNVRGISAWLGRTVRVEVGLAAVVLVLAAVLVDARPAKQSYTPTFHTNLKAGSAVRVAVSIPQPRSGPVTLRLSTYDAKGHLVAVPEIDATLNLRTSAAGLPAVAVAGLPIRLQSAGVGRFTSVGLEVPIPGVWTLNLTVRTNDIDEYYANPTTVAFR
jgi:copper transport protein